MWYLDMLESNLSEIDKICLKDIYEPKIICTPPDDNGEIWREVPLNQVPEYDVTRPNLGVRWHNNGAEPNLVELPGGRLMLLMRNSQDYSYVYYSSDRGLSDFRTRGSADNSVQQFQAKEFPFSKVLVAFGQHEVSRRLVIFDVNWLYERGGIQKTSSTAWNTPAHICLSRAFPIANATVLVDGVSKFSVRMRCDAPTGVSYVHLQTLAEDWDFLDTYIREIAMIP